MAKNSLRAKNSSRVNQAFGFVSAVFNCCSDWFTVEIALHFLNGNLRSKCASKFYIKMDENRQCTVGATMKDPCHKSTYCRRTGFKMIESLDSKVREVVFWTSGVSLLNIDADICFHHEHVLTRRLPMSYTKCFDPFNVHKKEVKGGLSKVTILLAKDVVTLGIDVVPGQKICPSCRMKVKTEIDSFGKELVQSDEEVNLVETLDNELSFSSNKESIDSALSEIDVSPLKLHSIPPHSKIIQGKRKLKQATHAFTKKVASVLDIDTSDLIEEKDQSEISKELKKDSEDLQHMIELIKKKLKVCNRRRRIQILTLIPQSWSIRKAAREFKVSKKTIQKALRLKEEKGILEIL